MSNHIIKEMDKEIDSLRNQLFPYVSLISKIIDWLEDEINHNEPILSGKEVLTDDGDTHAIHIGRTELAQGLLRQIKKWEEE